MDLMKVFPIKILLNVNETPPEIFVCFMLPQSLYSSHTGCGGVAKIVYKLL